MQLLSFEDFALALAKRESADNYKAKNRWGYLGRYQFGMARLCDLGLTQRKPGTKFWANDDFDWIPPHTEEEFLNTPALQDEIFRKHINDLVTRLYPVLSGLVAGAHLVGIGDLKNLLFTGKVAVDGFGTPITEYVRKFTGYELQKLGQDNPCPEPSADQGDIQ